MFKKKWKYLLSTLFILPMNVQASEHIELLGTYSSNPNAFTQGLELVDDKLLLSTGRYGQSAIGWLDIETGDFNVQDRLAENYFGEGITATKDAIWQFTWQEGTAFKRSLEDLSIQETINFDGIGWGLAYDTKDDILWSSDGTNVITKRNSETFEPEGVLEVTESGEPVLNINELEYANNALYANIWQSNHIIKINLENGEVEQTWDLTSLVTEVEREMPEVDPNRVLNGIAHINDDEFYVTGKLYPVIWKVRLN